MIFCHVGRYPRNGGTGPGPGWALAMRRPRPAAEAPRPGRGVRPALQVNTITAPLPSAALHWARLLQEGLDKFKTIGFLLVRFELATGAVYGLDVRLLLAPVRMLLPVG